MLIASFLALAPVAAVVVAAPITQVTVFSDRARVVRTASVTLAGTQRFELPLLNDSVDPASIRIEASGGEVRRVDIAHVDEEDFPRDEARALLGQIEALDDKVARVRGDRDVYSAMLEVIRRLSPAVPVAGPLQPPPRLNAGGWGAALAFVEGICDRLQGRIRDGGEKLFELGRERETLAKKAQLLGGAQRRSGYRVLPTVDGKGKVSLALSYMIGKARWYPSYDIQLAPEKGQVQVSFAGQVRQETGEDWVDAAITLSTAVPATATEFPELLTWKIGERDRFIPTPTPAVEKVPPAPPAIPPLAVETEKELLRRRLLTVGGAAVTGDEGKEDRDGDGVGDVLDEEVDRRTMSKEFKGKKRRPERSRFESEASDAQDSPAPPPPPAAGSPMPQAAPEAPAPAPLEESTSYDKGGSFAMSVLAKQTGLGAGTRVLAAQVGLAPPSGYRAPVYSPDLPASLAGGYDLSFPSLRPETVRSGKGARRVALFSESWPVAVERKLFPALAPEAYLVAEIKNPSSRVLPGGHASLFVGADPAGVATLKLVASGETFTLPLGLDRAVKPVRNVKLVATEKGFFSKDDVGEYTVTTEVANPYPFPLPVRILDQYPVTSDKNVEIKLIRTDPGAAIDKIKGALEWRMIVPPSGKSKVSFVYTLRRPKSWKMRQD